MPLSHSPSSRLLNTASSSDESSRGKPSGRSKRYGGKFASGFLEFYKQQELADCTVVAPDGREYRLHGLLLAYHSEFFRRALSSEFREGQERRIQLGFEDAGDAWPTLIEYFYTEEITLTDSNVLALFAASRELLIPAIQEYCADFAQSSLDSSNAIQFLSQAVQYNCDAFRSSCVALVASHFDTCYAKPTDGLPVEVMLEVLEHPQLYVQTEEQVLHFVMNYVRRHELDEQTVRALFRTVRLSFLSNDCLAALALMAEDSGGGASTSAAAGGGCASGPPRDMLLQALAQRLQLLDHPERLQSVVGGGGVASSAPHSGTSIGSDGAGGGGSAAVAAAADRGDGASRLLGAVAALTGGSAAVPPLPVPRKTYICTVEYGLPGGSEYVSVPMEAVWEELVTNLTVHVSGDSVDGDPSSVLRTHDDGGSWFAVSSDDPSRPVWVELAFPPHMRVVELSRYTFSHGMNMSAHMFPYGISDSSWFQMKGLATQVSPGDDDSFTPLRTTESCQHQTEFAVTVDPAQTRAVVWRRLRVLAREDNAQQVRLSIRKLKLYGRVEVSLLRRTDEEAAGSVGGGGPRDVVAAWRRRRDGGSSGRQYTAASALRGAPLVRLDHF